MITEVGLGTTILTTSKWGLVSIQAGYPNISHAVSARGNYPGARIYPGKFSSQQIVTEWIVTGSSFSDLADQREAFRKAVSAVLSQGEQNLRITKSNGVVLYIPIKAVKMAGDIKSDDGNAGSFLATFYAEYPFFRSLGQKTQDIGIFSGGGMSIPMAIPMDMGVGGSSVIQVENVGEYTSYPLITFQGALTDPTITNVTTGEQISLDYTLATSADMIVIDTYERTVVIQPSGNNGRQYASAVDFTLVPGLNEIRLTAGAYDEDGKVTLAFYDTYLGV